MAKPTLWFPYRLYLETFKPLKDFERLRKKLKQQRTGGGRPRIDRMLAALDEEEAEHAIRIQHSPLSDLPREFVSRQVFVTVRNAFAYPGGHIVNEVFRSNAPGRIPVTHDAESSPGELYCASFEVKYLPLFENIDLLVYCEQIFAACRQAFGIQSSRGKEDNVRPVGELLAIWSGSAARPTAWPDAVGLAAQGCPPWMASWITQHPAAVDLQSRRRYKLLGWEDLCLELAYDANATRLIQNLSRKSPASARADKAEIVHVVKCELTSSIFANAGRWATAASGTCSPNWRGYVIWQIAGKWDRELAKLLGVAQHDPKDDAPWTKGKEFYDALLSVIGCNGGLENLIGTAIEKGRIEFVPGGRSQDPLQSKFNLFLSAKVRYAKAVHFKAAGELERQIRGRPTPEQIQRAVMALLRAIDRRCVEDESELDCVLSTEIAKHLEAGFAWEPTHEVDWAVFGHMVTAIDPHTGLIPKAISQALPDSEDVGPEAPDDAPAAAVYGERVAALLESLSSPDLREALRLHFKEEEEDWMMYCVKHDLTLEEFKDLVQRALKELRDKAKKNSK